MTLRQLEILRAVIRHRTTVAAADELALSQPAISNALKAMEAQAGFALFERVNNRLFPTQRRWRCTRKVRRSLRSTPNSKIACAT